MGSRKAEKKESKYDFGERKKVGFFTPKSNKEKYQIKNYFLAIKTNLIQ